MPSVYSHSLDGVQALSQILAARGVPQAAIPGAIAGLMGESGGNLDPRSFNAKDPGGGSGGIAQWNRERLVGPSGMLAFARANGIPVDTNVPTDARKVPFSIQAQYLGHELDTTYSGVTKALRGAQTPQDALRVWVNNYEVPADKEGAYAQRSQYLAPVAKQIGMTINSIPTDSVSRETPTAAPTLGESLKKGDYGAALAALTGNKKDAEGNEMPGTSALDKLAGLGKPKEAAQQQSAPMLPAPDMNTSIAPAAQQLFSATMANAAKPLSWSAINPYGYGAGPQGLTLNSGGPIV